MRIKDYSIGLLGIFLLTFLCVPAHARERVKFSGTTSDGMPFEANCDKNPSRSNGTTLLKCDVTFVLKDEQFGNVKVARSTTLRFPKTPEQIDMYAYATNSYPPHREKFEAARQLAMQKEVARLKGRLTPTEIKMASFKSFEETKSRRKVAQRTAYFEAQSVEPQRELNKTRADDVREIQKDKGSPVAKPVRSKIKIAEGRGVGGPWTDWKRVRGDVSWPSGLHYRCV